MHEFSSALYALLAPTTLFVVLLLPFSRPSHNANAPPPAITNSNSRCPAAPDAPPKGCTQLRRTRRQTRPRDRARKGRMPV
ncbi:hypothetical protein K438DRAFT_1980879 [Mycena galopus ATCC 62051]|nr:hypothetical protein K438DRAFT_1980879 [Mycena galopus ATCC 62051]